MLGEAWLRSSRRRRDEADGGNDRVRVPDRSAQVAGEHYDTHRSLPPMARDWFRRLMNVICLQPVVPLIMRITVDARLESEVCAWCLVSDYPRAHKEVRS
jgi:hypothetical protein